MTEAELKRKLAAIEALLHGGATEGERTAAATVLEQLRRKGAEEAPVELQFTVPDPGGESCSWRCCAARASSPTACGASAAPPSW